MPGFHGERHEDTCQGMGGPAEREPLLVLFKGDGVAAQLGQAIGDLDADPGSARRRGPGQAPGRDRAQVVFLDFTLSEDEPGKLFRSAELARLLRASRRAFQGRGGSAQPARRRHRRLARRRQRFRRSLGRAAEVKDVVQRLLDTPSPAAARRRPAARVLLLGTRPGVGTKHAGRAPGRPGAGPHEAGACAARRASGAKPSKSAEAGAMQPLSSRVALLDWAGRWAIASCI